MASYLFIQWQDNFKWNIYDIGSLLCDEHSTTKWRYIEQRPYEYATKLLELCQAALGQFLSSYGALWDVKWEHLRDVHNGQGRIQFPFWTKFQPLVYDWQTQKMITMAIKPQSNRSVTWIHFKTY